MTPKEKKQMEIDLEEIDTGKYAAAFKKGRLCGINEAIALLEKHRRGKG